jgi:predicted phosphodiesterase
MRFGVVGDVHGNIHALEACLAALGRLGYERLLAPGDVVGYGPRPNECVARLRELDAVAVAGNHDLMAIGRLPARGLPPLQRRTIEWTREAIDAGTRAYLEALPLEAEPEPGLLMTHGGLGDPTRYVHDAALARVELAHLDERGSAARVLLLGHTHRAMACSLHHEEEPAGTVALVAPPWVVNAGSVGQSRERRPWARAALIDTDSAEVSFLALDYDLDATRRELRAAGLPPEACHLAPSFSARLRARVARAAR